MRFLSILLLWVTLYSYVATPTNLTTGYITYIDLLTSVVPNEPFINTFYFWWVHSTYIPYLFSLFILTALWISAFKPSRLSLLSTLLLFIIWSVELWDLLYANSQLTNLTTLSTSVNVLLANALNNYHPFIFYFSTCLLLSAVLVQLSSLVNYRVANFWIVGSWLNTYQLLVVGINLFAIFLGSWWAMQEGTWGGWWNWDSSEMFGLLPTLAALNVLHSSRRATLCWVAVTHAALAVVAILACYFLLQLNFDLVSHNFGARFFYFFNSNLVFVAGLSFVASLLVGISVTSLRWSLSGSLLNFRFAGETKATYYVKTYPTVLVSIVLVLWLIYSFFDFIEASRSVLLAFIVIIDRLEFSDLNTLLLITLYVLFSSRDNTARGYSYAAVATGVPTALPFGEAGLSNNSEISELLHFTLLYFTLLTILTNQVILKQWAHTHPLSLTYSPAEWLFQGSGTYILDSWSVEEVSYPTTERSSQPTNWRRWDLSNQPQSDIFDLTTSSWSSSGSLSLMSGYSLVLISVHSLWLPSLMTVTICAFTYLLTYLKFSYTSLYGIH